MAREGRLLPETAHLEHGREGLTTPHSNAPGELAGGATTQRNRRPEPPGAYRFGWYFRISLFLTGTTTTPSAEVTAKSFTTTHASSVLPPGGIGATKLPF
jgi:hypothetical protein